MAVTARDTRERLLDAASELFAERGFHGTKVREIAERAGVNLAAGNYHFGSKSALYLGVLRAQFAEIQALIAERGALPPVDLKSVSREQLIEVLKARIALMLDLLLGPPPGLHGTLMQREMCDPSEALPVIVEELINPSRREMGQIVQRLAPGLSPRMVERCVMSIVGQVFFYRMMRPAMLLVLGEKEYSRRFIRELAQHIADFSLGGMERLAVKSRRGRRAR
jgi:AcrR family transcriptional regulator